MLPTPLLPEVSILRNTGEMTSSGHLHLYPVPCSMGCPVWYSASLFRKLGMVHTCATFTRSLGPVTSAIKISRASCPCSLNAELRGPWVPSHAADRPSLASQVIKGPLFYEKNLPSLRFSCSANSVPLQIKTGRSFIFKIYDRFRVLNLVPWVNDGIRYRHGGVSSVV